MHEEQWILLEDYISEDFIFKIIFICLSFLQFSPSSCIYEILRVIVFFFYCLCQQF